jgi:meiotically up-regulated gene 157 (Mug157) protein
MSSPALALVGLLLICSVCVARIPPEQRRFVSPAIDAVIDDVSSRLRDPDVAKLFVNAYPNTLDTTVWNFTDSTPYPDSFIITGDIHAQWLRDSTNQILPYLPYAKPSIDAKLHRLACGLINRQARDILHDPFANAFNYDETGGQHMDDKRYPPMTAHVFEGKYELDSLAAFLKLSFGVYNWTGDFSCVDPVKWKKAVSLVIQTITAMQASTEEDFDTPSYLFQRQTTVATDTLMVCCNSLVLVAHHVDIIQNVSSDVGPRSCCGAHWNVQEFVSTVG